MCNKGDMWPPVSGLHVVCVECVNVEVKLTRRSDRSDAIHGKLSLNLQTTCLMIVLTAPLKLHTIETVSIVCLFVLYGTISAEHAQ